MHIYLYLGPATPTPPAHHPCLPASRMEPPTWKWVRAMFIRRRAAPRAQGPRVGALGAQGALRDPPSGSPRANGAPRLNTTEKPQFMFPCPLFCT